MDQRLSASPLSSPLFMQVCGTAVVGDDPSEVRRSPDENELDNHPSPAALDIQPAVREPVEAAEKRQGPRLEFSCDGSRPEADSCRVLVSATIDACSTTRLTIRNTGTTCVFYTWQREVRNSALSTRQDGVNRFFLDVTPGCILPGEFAEVNVSFSSPNAGIFTEPWQLVCQPALETAPVISLCGTSEPAGGCCYCSLARFPDAAMAARRLADAALAYSPDDAAGAGAVIRSRDDDTATAAVIRSPDDSDVYVLHHSRAASRAAPGHSCRFTPHLPIVRRCAVRGCRDLLARGRQQGGQGGHRCKTVAPVH